ncbi:MAG: hypothetical protein QF713_03750 [Dehalococcoidales bacterium]|nr:hypothetical protein [Dehalococcoidales bacterium]MDP7525431.1 hypothetical protein [Dehalococcoidales bacterium]
MKNRVRQVFVEPPPPELVAIPLNLRATYFDQFYSQFSELVPSTYRLDESIFGSRIRSDIGLGLSTAERKLGRARQYVGYFQVGYGLLMVIIALSVLGIVLLSVIEGYHSLPGSPIAGLRGR